MAASHTTGVERMASRCTPTTARATLALEIVGYSLHKGTGKDEFVSSTPISVGGYKWRISCLIDDGTDESEVSVFLELLSKPAELRVLYDLRFVNKANGLSSSVSSCLESPRVLGGDCYYDYSVVGLIKTSELEGYGLLQDDRLAIECDLTVIKEPLLVDESAGGPSNLSENLGNLLKTGEEADVTFEIEGEIFPAHKIVLAMRSPVFKAQLYGPMRDKTGRNIPVQDMQPAIFSALLHFIYTDLLPSMEHLDDDDEKKEMVKHLMVAADRYAIERLKMICEGILCKCLDDESVATMLALADQHQCSRLQDACVLFLISSSCMDDGIASQVSVHLKKLYPAVLPDILDRLKLSLKVKLESRDYPSLNL